MCEELRRDKARQEQVRDLENKVLQWKLLFLGFVATALLGFARQDPDPTSQTTIVVNPHCHHDKTEQAAPECAPVEAPMCGPEEEPGK